MLNSIPQVPNLACNLVSISKLTRGFEPSNNVLYLLRVSEFTLGKGNWQCYDK